LDFGRNPAGNRREDVRFGDPRPTFPQSVDYRAPLSIQLGLGLRDTDIRSALHRELQAVHSESGSVTRFVDELGVCGVARVDVAVLNGSFSGYELKSDHDSLTRLPGQIAAYSSVLDFASVVCTRRHLAAVRATLPRWWGLMEASTSADDEVLLKAWRRPRPNPTIDRFSLAQLLWRDEALEELAARGLDIGLRGSPRAQIWSRLAESLSVEEMRATVRERLQSRSSWRSDSL
jgi:hypothetical protein